MCRGARLDRIDVVLAALSVIFVSVGVLGIPADDADQAQHASMSSMTVSGPHVSGGLYFTMQGFCLRLTTTVGSVEHDSSSCAQWSDSTEDCDGADGAVAKICNNQHWKDVLAQATSVSLALTVLKVFVALGRCCTRSARARRAGSGARARTCCWSVSNILLAAAVATLLLGVVVVYSTQCYLGDDADAFVKAWPSIQGLAEATGFEPSLGPAFYNIAVGALLMMASTLAAGLAERHERDDDMRLPLNW